MDSLLSRAARVAGRVSPYAVVPFALSLAAVGKVAAAASGGGLSISVRFALPADVATLWTVLDPPTTGVAVNTPVPLIALPVFLAVEAFVAAGYLGGIRDAYRDRDTDFLTAASEHWLSILGVRVVQFVVFAGFGAALLATGPVGVLVAVPLFLLFAYLLWGAPYLVVLRDEDAVTALVASARLASLGDRYLWFSVGYAVAAAAASLVLSPLVTGAGIAGVVGGAALVAGPSLVGSAAATIVVDETAQLVASRTA